MKVFTKALKVIPMRSSLRLAKEYQAVMTNDLGNNPMVENQVVQETTGRVFPRIYHPYLTAGGWHTPHTKDKVIKGKSRQKQLSDPEIQRLMSNITNLLELNYQNRKNVK